MLMIVTTIYDDTCLKDDSMITIHLIFKIPSATDDHADAADDDTDVNV